MEDETDAPIEGTEAPQDVIAQSWALWDNISGMLDNLFRPWVGYQLLMAVGVFLLAYCLRQWLGPKVRAWMAARKGWPTWRMRILVMVHRRITWIFFVLLMWVLVYVMREVTWPSRSYVLAIIANVAVAGLVVSFASRLIKNPSLQRIVFVVAWGWIALRITNLTSETKSVLEAAAVTVGDTTISLWLVLQAVFVVSLLFAGARFLSRTSSEQIKRNQDMSPSMQVLLIKILQILLYSAAIFLGLKAVGFDLTGLAVLSGAIGVGLGFGLQKVVSNLVSGFIILLDKSIKPGDVISLGETFGWINSLGARYVSITTRDGREYLVPNEDLITGQVVNWSHSDDYVRLDIRFGTSYGDDPHLVRQLAIDAAKSVERVLRRKSPVCHITGFGDNSVDYILRFWITDPTGGLTNIRGNVYLALWDSFKENDISIPFPQREVRMLKD